MWDFPQYTSGEQAFSFSQGTLETMGAETGVGAGTGAKAQASRTALRIRCKSSSQYLGILVAEGGDLAKGFPPKSPAGWSDNLSPNLGGGKESGGATKEATEGETKGRSWRRCPRPRTEVILGQELIFF